MERSKGKIEAEYDDWSGTYSICADDVVCVFWHLDEETHNRFEYDNAKTNAAHLVECWNAFEPDGLVGEMVKALEGTIAELEWLEQDDGIPACQCTAKIPEDRVEPPPCNYCIAKAVLAKAEEGV